MAFDNFTPTMADLNGQLVLITVKEHLSGVETTFGDKDPLLVDLVVLYDEGPVEFSDFQVFQSRLIGALKGRVGNPNATLARIGQGAEYKGNVPWILRPPNGADQARARAYENGESYASPVTHAPTPTPVVAPEPVDDGDDPFAVRK